MNVQHSSRSDLWYTPSLIVGMVKEILEEIDLDPASDPIGNRIIGARRFITKEENGLIAPWGDRPITVYLNPPGGKIKNKSQAALFWQRLMNERDAGRIAHAIFMGFSAEILAISQGYGNQSVLDFPICVPAKRIQFVSPMEDKISPSHSNVIVYVPGTIDYTSEFLDVFSILGKTKG